jgi:hypothetical protein
VYDSSDEEELVPVREPTFSAGDYVHGSNEEDAAVAQVAAISAAEARALPSGGDGCSLPSS